MYKPGNITKLMALVFAVSFCTVGCAGTGAQKPKGDPVATFKGGTLTAQEVSVVFKSMEPMQRAQLQNPETMKKVIDQMAERYLIAQAAKDSGMAKDPEILTKIALSNNYLLAQAYIEKKTKEAVDKIKVSDKEADEYYNAHPQEFNKEQVKASHIIVESEEQIKKIYEEIGGSADKFAEAAKKYSKDGSAKSGGDLGWFGRGSMVPAFEQVVFSIEKGKVSEPFRTQFGWHLALVTDKSTEKTELNDKTREEIKQRMKDEQSMKISMDTYNAMVKDLKKKYEFKANEENYKKINTSGEEEPKAKTPAKK